MTEYEGYKEPEPKRHVKAHYYGDIVRRLFVGGGFVALLALPLYYGVFGLERSYPLFVIVILVVAAGLASPVRRKVHILNAILAALSLALFEWYALDIYDSPYDGDTGSTALFWLSHALAANFFFAFYYCVKTLRGMTER